jgi:hypothetical protein
MELNKKLYVIAKLTELTRLQTNSSNVRLFNTNSTLLAAK